ncbi:putative transcriptional regulator [Neorhizobium huautlense]|uniref:Transcriptional regulator n=1 Tax=Neorhizobium huautlense TaxID=67774 RepID=A0ABT9PX91_9HYPH|nr:hypothetical protein [Neorhizobium huautlense]MDP9838835.1 putative transcriptional regulator [Neorhizobium huautlense]
MVDKTFTFAVDGDLMTAFNDAAKAQDTTGDELLRQFMHDFVIEREADPGYDAWFRQQVEEGIAQADAGNVISSEEVERHFAERREQTLRKIGEMR